MKHTFALFRDMLLVMALVWMLHSETLAQPIEMPQIPQQDASDADESSSKSEKKSFSESEYLPNISLDDDEPSFRSKPLPPHPTISQDEYAAGYHAGYQDGFGNQRNNSKSMTGNYRLGYIRGYDTGASDKGDFDLGNREGYDIGASGTSKETTGHGYKSCNNKGIYMKGFEGGWSKGRQVYQQEYQKGYDAGKASGIGRRDEADLKDFPVSQGYKIGYKDGFRMGNSSYLSQQGIRGKDYTAGYNQGFKDSHNEFKPFTLFQNQSHAFQKGYSDGYEMGLYAIETDSQKSKMKNEMSLRSSFFGRK